MSVKVAWKNEDHKNKFLEKLDIVMFVWYINRTS